MLVQRARLKGDKDDRMSEIVTVVHYSRVIFRLEISTRHRYSTTPFCPFSALVGGEHSILFRAEVSVTWKLETIDGSVLEVFLARRSEKKFDLSSLEQK